MLSSEVRSRAISLIDPEIVDAVERSSGGDELIFCRAVARVNSSGAAAGIRYAQNTSGTKFALRDCQKCGKEACVRVVLAQTRSADEGESVLHRCLMCQAKWSS